MAKLPKQSECLSLFGNPNSANWVKTNTEHVPVPWAMHMDAIPIKSIVINRIASDSLARVLTKIWDRCDHTQSKIHAAGCDCFSGSYAVRPIRGGKAMSMHSFALAIDIDAPHNPLAAPATKTNFKANSLVVQAFKEEGWIWGGDWRTRRDAMHFQFAIVG